MVSYALRLENSADTAPRVRLGDVLGLVGPTPLAVQSGIRPAPDAADVDIEVGTMNVSVQPFMAIIQGGVADAQGGYTFVLDEQATLELSNGDAVDPRVDVIAVVIRDDTFDAGGSTDAQLTVIEGTPGQGAPDLPTTCLPLREIEVPAGASVGSGGLLVSALGADRRTYLDTIGTPPPGSLMPFAGTSEPFGWLLADGRAVSRATYPRLFAAIGTTYGAPDGSSFNLPNLGGRVPVGVDSTQTEFNAVGKTGGAKQHTLTANEIPHHVHDMSHIHPVQWMNFNINGNTHGVGSGDRVTTIGTGPYQYPIELPPVYQNTGGAGGGLPHNNLQPYISLRYLIKW